MSTVSVYRLRLYTKINVMYLSRATANTKKCEPEIFGVLSTSFTDFWLWIVGKTKEIWSRHLHLMRTHKVIHQKIWITKIGNLIHGILDKLNWLLPLNLQCNVSYSVYKFLRDLVTASFRPLGLDRATVTSLLSTVYVLWVPFQELIHLI